MSDPIVLTPTGSGQTGVSTGASLVTKIVRAVGGEDETELRVQGLDCLNRVRIEFNQHDWHFTKTTASPITLVSGTRTYSLPTTFKKPSYAVLIDSSSDTFRTLVYRDDAVQGRLDEQLTDSGTPYFYWLRNDFNDGYVSVYPDPDTSAAADYRLSVEYFPRLGAFSDSDIQLSLPEEVENLFVLGGQAYIMRERGGKDANTITQAFADYMRSLNVLKTHDRRVGDEIGRFRLANRKTAFDSSLYIRIK